MMALGITNSALGPHLALAISLHAIGTTIANTDRMNASRESVVLPRRLRHGLPSSQMKRCVSIFSDLNRDTSLSDVMNPVIYFPAHSISSNMNQVEQEISSSTESQIDSQNSVHARQQLRQGSFEALPDIYTRLQTQLFPQIPF